jgi:hypothetical protein
MARFEDSCELFGAGMGSSTEGEVICEFCGKVYNKGIAVDDDDCSFGESVPYTTFAGKQVCYCCFEKIENEVRRRMVDIIPWFKRILDVQKEFADLFNNTLNSILKRSE